MADYSTCQSPNCGTRTDGAVAICPRCGGPMRTLKGSRTRGGILLFNGLFLLLLPGALIWGWLPILPSTGGKPAGSIFEGAGAEGQIFILLLALLSLFGLATAIYGVYQIATDRPNPLFMRILGAMLVVMLGLVLLIKLTATWLSDGSMR